MSSRVVPAGFIVALVLSGCQSKPEDGSGPLFTVTVTATDVMVTPDGAVQVGGGDSQSFLVAASSGYLPAAVVGGTCPMGSWGGYIYTTGTITADCTVVFSGIPAFQVTPSGTNVIVAPNTAQTVASGGTQAFSVSAEVGYTLSTTVGGTCPAGSWASTVYTTGAITADCTVTFSGTPPLFQVTSSGTNVTIAPSTAQSVASGSTQAFTVTPATGYTVSTTVGGTCPAGTWAADVYTTGAITSDCTVTFSGTPAT